MPFGEEGKREYWGSVLVYQLLKIRNSHLRLTCPMVLPSVHKREAWYITLEFANGAVCGNMIVDQVIHTCAFLS